MHKKIFLVAVVLLFLVSVVVPNSLPLLTSILLVLCTILGWRFVVWDRVLKVLFILYSLGVLVTLVYLVVGVLGGAPSEAVFQVLVIYVASPFMWMVVAAGLVRLVEDELIIKWIVILSCLCNISVALFFYLFLNYGADSVSFFKETANVNLEEGYAGATMYVYGSLIFLAAGFFSIGSIVSNPLLRGAVLCSLFVVCVTSGRSALLMAMPLGVLIGFVLNPGARTSFKVKSRLKYVVFATAIAFFVVTIGSVGEVDLFVILNKFYDEFASGGGSERTEQFEALTQGIYRSFALGVGHGIGVDYLRNDEFPWRYELVWVATVLRVGIVGSLVYISTLIYGLRCFYILVRTKRAKALDFFLFSGFFSAFLASNTNPYIEGFALQWMYVVPVVFWVTRSRRF